MDVFTYDFNAINELFLSAKERDEFEFICTILRVRGMETTGWDSLRESHILINQLLSLVSGPLDNSFRARMLLLLYCHITEMNDIYSIIANLLRVISGERYVIDPFYHKLFEDGKIYLYPEGKVKRIIELCKKVDKEYIGELFRFMINKQIRNAFFHSDYTIFKDEFRIINGEGVNIDGITTHVVPISNWLNPRIEVTINFVHQLLDLLSEYRMSYQEKKVIKGRLGPKEEYIDVTLTVNKQGLVGFRS